MKMDSEEKPILEILMPYGWVVMVVVGVIGALSYFKVLNLPIITLPTGSVVLSGAVDSFRKYTFLLIFVLIFMSLFFYFKYFKKTDKIL